MAWTCGGVAQLPDGAGRKPFIGTQTQYEVAFSANRGRPRHTCSWYDSAGWTSEGAQLATLETAIYALQGASGVWHGERLEQHTIVEPGDFFYIPGKFRICPKSRARSRWLRLRPIQ